jgi:hypothetical protein
MTVPTRGARARRGNRRPGSLLLTTLLVLAIVASSVLVFTNKVELLKLAVIVALWAAVVAAFVSFIYRRQSDIDQAKSRDLKLVYDLQLDREISARREYELSIESQLRRELASELRAETSDEVAALRAELAALRANLEIIFDTDLQSRPAIETERTTVHTFGDWGSVGQGVAAPERGDRSIGPGRVISSRIDTEAPEDFDAITDPKTEESPIIDVPAVPQPPDDHWSLQNPGGAHRRPSEPESVESGWRAPRQEPPPWQEGRRRAPEPSPAPEPVPTSDVRGPWTPAPPPPPPPPQQPPHRQEPEPPERPAARYVPTGTEWRPAPAEGQYIPAGSPGSNWAAPAGENGTSAPTADGGEGPATAPPAPVMPPPPVTPPPPPPPVTPPPTPAMTPPPTEEPRKGRHYPAERAETAETESARRARHSSDADPGRPTPPPTLASPTPPPPATPTPPPPASPTPPPEAQEPASSRHREADDAEESAGQHIGGQPLSELMARLQVGSTAGGRRRRRDE